MDNWNFSGAEQVHLIDGSFEGLLSSVFHAYSQNRRPAGIFCESGYQQDLAHAPIRIATDHAKAERVRLGLLRKLGGIAYEQVWTAFLSSDEARYVKIFRFIALGFQVGRSVTDRLAEPAVMDVLGLSRLVTREYSKLLGFVRFSVMENGVQFSEITPEQNLIPLLTPHFADRFPDVPFVIYDSRRKLAGVYDTRAWGVAAADGLKLPEYSADELAYRALWRRFYDAIAIDGRKNSKLQQSFMPKRYWRNMTETK
jgi:probable DNA metabolism protein